MMAMMAVFLGANLGLDAKKPPKMVIRYIKNIKSSRKKIKFPVFLSFFIKKFRFPEKFDQNSPDFRQKNTKKPSFFQF